MMAGNQAMKIGRNLLVTSRCPADGTWSSVLRAMGAAMVEQLGYAQLLVQVTVEEILASPAQPRIHADRLAVAEAQLLGLEQPLVVVTVLEGQETSRASFQPRHVLLRVSPSIPSESEARWIASLTECLEEPATLKELLQTKTPLEFGVALQDALNAHSDPPGRNPSNGPSPRRYL
ncbi:MAG: hypothetical protein L0170_04970 [Acidobacteria bacterium]|nr:hypothetical protein [Acidobacteriota bacterium]